MKKLCLVWIAASLLLGAGTPPAQLSVRELSGVDLELGVPRAVTVSDGKAYVANGQGGLTIVDLARGVVEGRWVTGNPGHRTLEREWVSGYAGEATAVAVSDGYAFLLLQRQGYDVNRCRLLRLDVRRPSHPVPAGEVLLGGLVPDFCVMDGQRVFVIEPAGRPGFPPGLTLWSFADASRPERLATLSFPRGELSVATKVAVQGNQVTVVGTGKGGARQLRASWEEPTLKWAGPSEPVTAPAAAPDASVSLAGGALRIARSGKVVSLSGSPKRVRVGNGTVLVCGKGLQVFQGTTPQGRLLPDKEISDALVAGAGHFYAASGDGVWEVVAGQAPRSVGPACSQLALSGSTLFGSDATGVGMVGGNRLELEGVTSLAASGTLLASGRGRRGIQLVDVSDPTHPRLRGRWYDEAHARMSVMDVALRGTTLLVADADNGLSVLDVSNPDAPKLQAFLACPNALSLSLLQNKVVVANGVYGLVVADLAHLDGARGTPLRDCWAVAADGVHLFALDSGRLCKLGLVEGGRALPRLELRETVPIPMGIPSQVAVSADGKRAWVANDEGWNVVEIDLSEMGHLKLARILETGGFCHGVAAAGKWIAATASNTVQFFTGLDTRVFHLANAPKPGDLFWTGALLWIQTKAGLQSLDTRDERKIVAGPSLPERQAVSTWKAGNKSYLGAGDAQAWHRYDVSDSLRPQPAGQFVCPNVTASAADSQGLYLGTGRELIRVDDRLQETGRIAIPGGVGALALSGPYVITAGKVLTVVDRAKNIVVRQVPAPPNAGTYGPGPSYVDVKGFRRDGQDLVAALDKYYGLRVFSLPELRESASFATSGGDYTGITVDAGHVYVGNNWGGLYSLERGMAVRPQWLTPNAGCTGPLAQGGRQYFQGNTNRTLYIAEAGKILGQMPLKEQGGAYGDDRRFGSTFPELRGNLLYTPGYARIVDVADPSKPKLLGECLEAGFQNDSCALATVRGRLYEVLTCANGLKVVDVQDPRQPKLVGTLPGDYEGGYYFGRGLQVVGSIAYVCNRSMLNIIDLSQPNHPTVRSAIELGAFPVDVVVCRSTAYVACYYGGLEVVDVKDPDHPHRVGHFQQGMHHDGPGWDNLTAYQSIALDGNNLYLTEYYSGLQHWTITP